MNGLFDLTGETAVVIGATGVLGGGLAEGLAAAGAAVAVVGRNAARGEERAEAIRRQGGKGIFYAADALQRGALSAVRDRIELELGAPTILVNAAGGNDQIGRAHV